MKLNSISVISFLVPWRLPHNADKCHLLVTTKRSVSANIGEFVINNSNEEKLLGIKIDTKLSFENHVSSLCKKASQKLHALARIVNYMDLSKRKSLMKAFITSQFNYCPLIWMFYSRELSNRINRIHERALRLVYQDNSLSFAELLEKDNSVTIHLRNLQLLATEIYKLKNGLACRLCKKYIAQVGFIWSTSTFCNISEEKIQNLYIFCIFWFFIYILYLFIVHNGEVSPGFPVFFLCAISADFLGDLPKGLRRRCIFLGISSLGNWVKFLYFVQWLSLSFMFYQFICLFIYLFIYLSIYLFTYLFICLFIYFFGWCY